MYSFTYLNLEGHGHGIIMEVTCPLLLGSFYYGTFLQQLECGYRFPALIHVWIASAGVLELFISTSGEATSACKPFWHNGWGNSGMNECRKSIPTRELLQENHSLMFWQFGKFHISTSAQKLSCYIFQYPMLIWQVFIC
jgi:hypothetical protein